MFCIASGAFIMRNTLHVCEMFQHFMKQYSVWAWIGTNGFENILGKCANACDQIFFLFPTIFLTFFKANHKICIIERFRLLMFVFFTSRKFHSFAEGMTLYQMTKFYTFPN